MRIHAGTAFTTVALVSSIDALNMYESRVGSAAHPVCSYGIADLSAHTFMETCCFKMHATRSYHTIIEGLLHDHGKGTSL